MLHAPQLRFGSSVLALTLLVLLSGCSLFQRHNTSVEAEREATLIKDSRPGSTVHYTVISFKEGQTQIEPEEQQKLRTLAATAKKYGKSVDEFRVLAWADKDDPTQELSKDSPELAIANARALAVRKYLKEELKTRADIEVHNMARKPSSFNEVLKGDDFEIKTTFENTGAASLGDGPKSSLAGSKASKVIILVRYEQKKP